jgi:hypothetical protein
MSDELDAVVAMLRRIVHPGDLKADQAAFVRLAFDSQALRRECLERFVQVERASDA